MSEIMNAIGETAGKIYRALEAHRELTLQDLKDKTRVQDTALVHQALGWLARGQHPVHARGKTPGFHPA